MNEQRLNKILYKLDSMDGRFTNLEGQMSETNEIVQALLHQNEVLNAEVSGLKITTANAESIERIETKIDILSHRILAQNGEFQLLKQVKQ